VATNAEGANMDAGLVAALAGTRDTALAALEVDEMHVPHVADALDPSVIVLLNLSRDQLDRVGEINHIERTLRGGLARHPSTVVVANCDDVLMTSAAYDSPHVVWVAAGGGWAARLSCGMVPSGIPPERISSGPAHSGGSTNRISTGPTGFRCR
jgi:lipid II isoglutaminyl synthase (glutamine-hydrolysing)